MPVIRTYTSEPVSESQRDTLKSFYGALIAKVPGKSEPWLMCVFDDDLPIYMGLSLIHISEPTRRRGISVAVLWV